MGCSWFTGTQSYPGGSLGHSAQQDTGLRDSGGQPWSAGLPSMPPAQAPEECLHQPTPTRGLHRHTITTAEVFTPLTAASPWAREPHRQRDSRNSPEGGTVSKDDPPGTGNPTGGTAHPPKPTSHPSDCGAGMTHPASRGRALCAHAQGGSPM